MRSFRHAWTGIICLTIAGFWSAPQVAQAAGGIDCNTNEIDDVTDIESGASLDCNTNGIPDECDAAFGTTTDCDEDGVPDECEADCNTNGIPDPCDMSLDCNENGVPDECDVAEEDCNTNGIPDACDIAVGTSEDCNSDGIPDDCNLRFGPSTGDFVSTPDLVFPDEVEMTDTITIDSGGTFTDLNVDLAVTHIFIGDTEYRLHKGGVTIFLLNHVGGSGENIDVLLDDEGPPLSQGEDGEDGTLFGTFQPDQQLSAFDADGQQNGAWTIHCLDTFEGSGTGVLNQWSLHFSNPSPDCQGDGIPDECQLEEDCDGNSVPDECDPDCNTNGSVDACDLATGDFADCNTDGIPDECELASLFIEDFPNTPLSGGVTITPPILVSGTSPITDLNVGVDIQDVFIPGITIVILHEEVDGIVLFEGFDDLQMGGPGSFIGTIFDDEAEGSILDGEPPFTGAFQPVEPLSALDGTSMGGEWALLVDTGGKFTTLGDDSSAILHWSLQINGSGISDCNSNGVLDECEGLSDCNGNGIPDVCEPEFAQTCPGDTSGDGSIDGDDIQGFVDCFGAVLEGDCDPCASADMDLDGDVDIDDLGLFNDRLLSGEPVDLVDSDEDGVPDCADACPTDPAKSKPGLCGCGVSDADDDIDGVPNCEDACPDDPGKSDPGACGCGAPDADSDEDGVPDCEDACPDDPAKTDPGACGCGTPDADADGDGAADCVDGCPDDPAKTDPGACGCGVADADADADGTADCDDGCPDDPAKTDPGACGCGVADADVDGDGTADCDDGCPNDANKTAPGECGCGVAEEPDCIPCPSGDDDGDGVCNSQDICPGCDDNLDADADGVPDGIDNCPDDANAEQQDFDKDGIGDACDELLSITCPDDIVVTAPDETGLAVNFAVPPAPDGAGNVTVTVTPEAGSVFPIGTTQVTIRAVDDLTGAEQVCTFNVTVQAPPPPGGETPPPGQETPETCNETELEALRWLLQILFRAPVCGMGCLTALPLTLVGWAGMKAGLRRRKRR